MTIESLLTSAFVLLVLLFTQYPSVPGGDGGLLIAEACIGGIGHPPGYPLFIMLGSLSVKLAKFMKALCKYIFNQRDHHFLSLVESFFNPARCVNTLCCILGAAACYFLSNSISLYLFTYHSSKTDKSMNERSTAILNIVCGCIGGAVFTLSPLVWEYTRMAEVFALNNMLIAVIIYQTVHFGKLVDTMEVNFDNILGCSMTGAFFSGLAISNQHTALLFIIPIAVYVLFNIFNITPLDKRAITMLRVTGTLALCFIGGLLPYLYIFIVSHSPTKGTWGNQTNLRGFLRHIMRSEYGSLSLAAGEFTDVEGFTARIFSYIKDAFKQTTAVGVFLSCQGILCTMKNFTTSTSTPNTSSNIGVLLFCTWIHYLMVWNGIISNLPLSNPMALEVQSRFYIQPNILVCFFIGVGAHCTLSKLLVSSQSDQNNKNVRRGLSTNYLFRFILIVVLGGCVTRQHICKYWTNPVKGMLIHDYAEAILSSLPEQSLLLSYSDLNWLPLRYLQACEEKRKDITHLSLQLMPYPWFKEQQSQLYPHVRFPYILDDVSTDRKNEGYIKYLTRFLKANLNKAVSKGGIYIEMQSILDTDIQTGGLFNDDFTIVPWGLVYRIIPRSDDNDNENDQTFTTLREKWQSKSLHQLSKVSNKMKRHNISMIDSSEVSRGSWEFAAVSVVWDMYYQLGLHILGIALTLPMAIKDDVSLLPVYVENLRVSSKLLKQVDSANEIYDGIVNQNRGDIIKNNALTHLRLDQAVKLYFKVKHQLDPSLFISPSISPKSYETKALNVLSKYLHNFYSTDDPDYAVFHDYFYSLLNDE